MTIERAIDERGPLTEIYRALACPDAGGDRIRDRLLDLIEGTHAQQTTKRVLADHHVDLQHAGSGVQELITRWLDRPTDFATAWATPLIELYSLFGAPDADAVPAAAALAMHLSSSGEDGSWSSRLAKPANLRWGAYLLPAADRIEVQQHAGDAQLDLATSTDQHRIALTKQPAGWHADDLRPLPATIDGGPRLLNRAALPRGFAAAPDVVSNVVNVVSPGHQAAFAEALTLIGEHAPAYLRWVMRVVTDIVVLEVPVGQMRSGSNTSWPGLVYMSAAAPIVLAENLVHESSHQYFHLLERVEDTVDGSDGALYYSPPTRRERPLSAILVAYHAFANVALFLRTCSALVDGAEYVGPRVEEVLGWLDRLEEPIRTGGTLTDAGCALVDPLADRLAMTRLRD
jgi:HEXXH motif-containing protein